MRKTITVLTTADISTVQGSTEPYYVVQELSKKYDLHLISPTDPAFEGVTHHQLPACSFVPALFWYNVCLLPLYILYVLIHQPSVLYTYKYFTLAPWFISTVFKTEWIIDLRTAPTDQIRESDLIQGNQSRIRKLYLDLLDITYRQTLPTTKAVFTLSEKLMDRLQTDYGVPTEKITLIPVGVNTAKFDPKSFRSKRSISHSTDTIHIVYLGSIVAHRGLDICINALAMRAQLHPTVIFHIVGDGPDDEIEMLRRQACLRGVENSIVWHGYIDHNDVPKTLSEMDLAISPLPAYDSYEVSSPAKLYEYLSMGLPVICSDIRPHRELLVPGITGFFFKSKTPESLLSGLNNAISDFEVNAESRSIACRDAALAHDWKSRTDLIESIIES